MKKIFKRTTAGAVSLAIIASAAAALPITASAEENTIYERGSVTSWSEQDVTDWSWTGNESAIASINADHGFYADNNQTGFGTKMFSVSQDAIVTYEVDFYTASSTGREGNYAYVKFGSNVSVGYNSTYQLFYSVDGGTIYNSTAVSGNVNGQTTKITAVVNTKKNTLVSLTVGNTVVSSAANTALTNASYNSISMGFVRSGSVNWNTQYGLKNVKVSENSDSGENNADISTVTINGESHMSFGPDSNTAAANNYSLSITDTNGSVVTTETANEMVDDFNVVWDIDGFATKNDNPGQYCDSYGAFAVNNAASTDTVFNLKNVPMNFYGKMTATITYNGETYTAEKPVVALGNTTTVNILPEGGYPSDFDTYPDSLVGYSALRDTFGTKYDSIIGGWVFAGSYGNSTAKILSEGTNKYLRVATDNGNSHSFSNSITSPQTQAIFKQRVRFNSGSTDISLNTKVYSANNTRAVELAYSGNKLKLNNVEITDANDNEANILTNTWYDIVLSVDKTNETCYVLVNDAAGNYVGGIDNIKWLASCNPTFLSIGSPGKTAGSIDIDNYSAYYAAADVSNYTLTPSQDTLSIPNKDTADLSAALYTAEGYPMTGKATWTVLEDDMAEGVVITPDENDSHKAKVTLADTAEAGTATVQVNIGGYTKTVELNITSSDESVKFTKSSASVSIPLDNNANTVEYAASIVNGTGTDTGAAVTLALYDKNNTNPYTLPAGITFDASTGILTVDNTAPAVTFTIRATGLNSKNESISKGIKVTVHGLSFDFGAGTDDDLAEGFTAVSPNTSYTAARGYGISAGTVTAEGTGSTDNAASDYLSGAMTFKANVTKGKNYTVDIVYQGTLKTGIFNSDLAGYTLGTNESLAAASYTVPVPIDVLDLDVSGDGAKIASVTITKQADKSANAKPDIHHIGDSTSANNGSWAYRLAAIKANYTDLTSLATFNNNGAGGRNLSTYYTQGRLASVLSAIEPGDIVMFGNNGTNGMGSTFEADANYYLDAAEAMGAKIIINSYTPHGAVAGYASGYNSSTNTFNCYRQDSYDVIVRQIAEERAASDPNYLGFVEIGKNADAIFTAYAADYAANGYESADAAAQAIITCFTDHNHYSNGTLACDLMLNGYGSTKGIVAQLVDILSQKPAVTLSDRFESTTEAGAAAVGYVAEYMQNNYDTQSVTWNVTHKTDANKYMKVDVEVPTTGYGTTVQLGIILEGNIDEVGEVSFTIN